MMSALGAASAKGKPLEEPRLDHNFAGIKNLNNYTGYTYDYVLDIYFAQNRFYNPDTRQFIIQDPIKDGMNWYVYCEANPLVNVDLRGLAGTSKAKLSEAALILLFTNNSAVIQESYDNSRRSIRISEQYALSNGFTQIKTQGAGIFKREVIVADTWFNEPDVYRHFIWNVYNVRDLGERDAIIATNMHEINAFKDG